MEIPQRSPSTNTRDTIWAIGILLFFFSVVAGVVVFISSLASTSGGPESECIRSLSGWKDALEEYKNKTGAYPEDDNLADAHGLELVLAELYPGTNAPPWYLTVRDPWGEPFRYKKRNEHRYQLGSTGGDRDVGQAGRLSAFGDGDDITIDNGRL